MAAILLEYRIVGRHAALPPAVAAAPVQATPAMPARGDAQQGLALGALAASILERPLFSPSRRPGQLSVAATEVPRLAGIIIGPTGAKAIFAGAGDGRAIVAGTGAQAGPYLIRSIGMKGVSVIGPNGPELLHPDYDRNATQSAAGPGEPGAGGVAGPAGIAGASPPSILDLLRARMQTSGGVKPVMPLVPNLPLGNAQIAPGNHSGNHSGNHNE